MSSNDVQNSVVEFLLETLRMMKLDGDLLEDVVIDEKVRLIGGDSVIDSRSVVELLLALEEFLEDEYDASFDWSSDRAMSMKRSPFRTPLSLAQFSVAEAGL